MNKFLFLTLFSLTTQACLINGANSLIVFGKEKRITFDSKDCSTQQIQSISEFVKESSGTISNSYMKRIPELKTITIKPESIRVRRLEDIVHNRLNLSNDQKVELIQQDFSSQFYKLNNDEFLEVYCEDCNNGKINNFKIVKSNGTTKETTWVKGKVLTAVKSFIAKKNINLTFQPLNKADFEFKTIYVASPERVFTTNHSLSFFRLNKTIRKGHTLESADLTPVPLVQYGTPVSVQLNKDNLNMKLMANPLATGKLGDTVRLKNRNSNKIFFGKVIGINKVKVEL